MKILITGCCGFIGSHLCETLLKLQYTSTYKKDNIESIEILGIDNMNNYYDPSLKFKNLKIIQSCLKVNDTRFMFLEQDIRNTKAIIEWKPHIVIHLAGMAGVRYSIQNPTLYSEVNVTGFINIIEQCRLIKCRLIYASSSSVYGLNLKIPFAEYDNINNCNSPYAATMRSKEILAQTYSQLYSIETIGLRFFTVYGPRGRPDMAPFKFLNNIMNDIPIDKYGDGSSSRDFTYISDIIDGIISTIKYQMPSDKYQIFNLGNNNPVSLNKFIKICEKVTNKKAIINYLDNQLGDVSITYADITKAKYSINYIPKVTLQEGLQKTYDYIKNNQ